MKDALEKLKEFHRVFNCARQEKPEIADDAVMLLRKRLMQEELGETLDAMHRADLVEIADGLADLCYVAIGTAVAYGIPLDKVFEEVHRSNMDKALLCECNESADKGQIGCELCKGLGYHVRYRPDGKVLKPDGWSPPNIGRILKEFSK